jgi:starch synthase (maltosyl-transferring)
LPDALTRRTIVERVRPSIDGGRFPVKRTVGDVVTVTADIFADGHDVVQARLRHRRPTSGDERSAWCEVAMELVAPGRDEWAGMFDVPDVGVHEYCVVAWVDRFLSWRHELQKKAAFGQESSVDLLEGSLLVVEAAERGTAPDASRDWLRRRADALSDRGAIADRVALAMDERLRVEMILRADRSRATMSPVLTVWVDRDRARFGSWYEMFPRSAGGDASRSGTFREAAASLSRIADLGFDVIYMPPIHPIGRRYRKGPNNTPTAGPNDPGSPWAIGSHEGGHTAIEPGLGTLDDFLAFRAEAARLGLEVALDLAWQCSPDHPWVTEHPEWFRHRPDGTIKYAENPPKKYQDIYPLDFESEDRDGLWHALLDVTRAWIDRGIRIFRVDNPHTKTFGFWEWFIASIRAEFPDVVFLSEAFTRPAVMRYLAKAGFSQSYTYFTWRNTKAELTEYFTELTQSEAAEYLRPNLFANTPDILTEYLQQGGRPAFAARLLLAATLGANYGIYSGFELCEAQAVGPGSEEYLDSEKYQFRPRAWAAGSGIVELVARVNQARRTHRALQIDRTLRFHATDNDAIIAYSKTSPDGRDRVMTIVNLDPHHTQHGFVDTPVDEAAYTVRDLLDDTDYRWRRGWNYVRFEPEVRQGHLLCLPTPRT